MDWSLIIFIVVIGWFAYRGYKKGFGRSLSRVLSLLCGYAATIFYTEQVSVILDSLFQLKGLVGLVVAALFLFIAAGIAVSFLFLLISKLMPETDAPSAASAFGGAALGLAVGVIVAFAIVWTFAFVRDIRPTEAGEALAGTNNSSIESLSNRLASKIVSTAMSLISAEPEIARLSAALVEAPAEITLQAQRLARSDDLNALLGDPQNQAVLNRGDVEAVQRLPAFQQLANNPDMQALAKSAGMSSDTADNNEAVEVALANQIVDIWGRMERMNNDKRVQEILSDPEFQQKLQSRNPVDLLTNAPLLELANIIFSDTLALDNTADNEPISVQPDSNLQAPAENKLKIYSWVDENGRIHYSDIEQKP